MIIWTAFKRLRHSHGFGVHSPYAYRFVGSVINPPRGYAYYAEREIEGLVAKEPDRYRMEADARTLLRIAAFVNPQSAYLPASAHKCFRFALRSVNRNMLITDNPAQIADVDFAAVSSMAPTHSGGEEADSSISPDALADFISRPGKTLLISNIGDEQREALFESMKEGVMFEGKGSCILLSRPGIWKVRYLMSL